MYLRLRRYYFPHHDARGAPRAATFIFYLTDVEEGGETVFVDIPAQPSLHENGESVRRQTQGNMTPDFIMETDFLDPSPEDIASGFVPLSMTPWRLQTPSVRAKFEAVCQSDHYLKVCIHVSLVRFSPCPFDLVGQIPSTH